MAPAAACSALQQSRVRDRAGTRVRSVRREIDSIEEEVAAVAEQGMRFNLCWVGGYKNLATMPNQGAVQLGRSRGNAMTSLTSSIGWLRWQRSALLQEMRTGHGPSSR